MLEWLIGQGPMELEPSFPKNNNRIPPPDARSTPTPNLPTPSFLPPQLFGQKIQFPQPHPYTTPSFQTQNRRKWIAIISLGLIPYLITHCSFFHLQFLSAGRRAPELERDYQRCCRGSINLPVKWALASSSFSPTLERAVPYNIAFIWIEIIYMHKNRVSAACSVAINKVC